MKKPWFPVDLPRNQLIEGWDGEYLYPPVIKRGKDKSSINGGFKPTINAGFSSTPRLRTLEGKMTIGYPVQCLGSAARRKAAPKAHERTTSQAGSHPNLIFVVFFGCFR
jgi:hypothetical protein